MPSPLSFKAALEGAELLPSTLANLHRWLDAGLPDWALQSLTELIAARAWDELNDRFYRDLEFGTGGMRGRTIGRVSTTAEQGVVGPWARRNMPPSAAIYSTTTLWFVRRSGSFATRRRCWQRRGTRARPRWLSRTMSGIFRGIFANSQLPRGPAWVAKPTFSPARVPLPSLASRSGISAPTAGL